MKNSLKPHIILSIYSKIAIIAFLLIATAALFVTLALSHDTKKSIQDYQDCIMSKGSRTLELYPSICIAPDGRRFQQPLPD